MIFITGDTHRQKDIEKLGNENFAEQKLLTKNDYVIIAGDFGAVWTGDARDEEVLDYYSNRNFTTLFIGGNHENYDLIEKHPVEEWHGGKVRKIRDDIIFLMNGQVYEIDGKKIFTMGGATSVDRMFRTEHVSWWAQEEPSDHDFKEAVINLKNNDSKVDYIITHTCPETVRKNAFEVYNDFIEYSSKVEQFLDIVIDSVEYKKWFCGHIHIDREFSQYRLRVLFNGIQKI